MGEGHEERKSAADEAREILASIQKEKADLQAWTLRAEAARAEQILSGKADAGQAPAPVKEETPKEYAARVMRGGI